MDNKQFNARALPETMLLLCESKGKPYFNNGKIHQPTVAKGSGISQSLLSRALSGSTRSLTDANVKKLAKFFKVTPSQMRGEYPILEVDGHELSSEDDLDEHVLNDAKLIAEAYAKSSPELQEAARRIFGIVEDLDKKAKG